MNANDDESFERLGHCVIFMTDTGLIQRGRQRRIANDGKIGSQKCGDELQNWLGAEYGPYAKIAALKLFFCSYSK